MSLATLDCPHQEAPASGQICEHLIADPELEHCRWFTGVGRVFALLCTDCVADHESGVSLDEIDDRLGFVCAECLERARAGIWSPERGVLGAPEVAERPEEHTFVHDMVRFDVALEADILDFRPVDEATEPVVIALLDTGELFRLDLSRRAAEPLLSVELEPGAGVALEVAPRGELAAVIDRGGRRAIVLDLERKAATLELERHPEEAGASQFPLAFFERGGVLFVVYESAPGRLDVSEPKGGKLLTGRELPGGEVAYHHGLLRVGPGGAWLADSGWVDGPAGFVSVCSLDRWLGENQFEADDGPTRKYFEQRWFLWDLPMCWIDQHTLALWGFGPAEGSMLDAAILYDVEAGELLRWFPGPAGRFAFDGWLYSMSDELGTSVWDVETGERVHLDPGFHPQRYSRGAKRFLSAHPRGEFFVVSRLVTRS